MDIMLFSNGKLPENTRPLEYGLDWIKDVVERTGVKKLVFIPYAVIRASHDDRTQMVQDSLGRFGCEVVGIHQAEDPVKAIEEADGILVSGGNTWVLNKTLHDKGLIGPIRKAVLKQNKLYIGWSAGTNIGSPTIRTTNDMPIVTAAVLPSLNLIPFQINPHYIEASIDGHMGETRDERIEEFLLVNPHEIVVGIPEGTMLHVHDGHLHYYTANGNPLKLFRNQQEAEYFNADDDIQFLMEHSC
ncbi:dipeptidase PepE [uncultured Photobacterium sp.]|uniref:dipeptidase PepE n=1 Tax=uncultured Photobacterium sp. TaxID=173973 RepID=UPI0026093BDE|nr:dipeptidase PepE [uncultured Photobacterium sp.]